MKKKKKCLITLKRAAFAIAVFRPSLISQKRFQDVVSNLLLSLTVFISCIRSQIET